MMDRRYDEQGHHRQIRRQYRRLDQDHVRELPMRRR